ncbi:MAG: phosphopentomutase [Legionella sp.]|nr:MAG: phosphopentomutase [Legionella sp.]
MTLPRVCILLMDSLGIGASLDADLYGDSGANTFGHIVEACRENRANKPGVRSGPLHIPNLARRGLYHAAVASAGTEIYDLSTLAEPEGYFGYAVEQSLGKDTPSGHWEIAGVPVMFPWGYFPKESPCFPTALVQDLIQQGHIPGVLGQIHASGTDIIDALGEEHILSGCPILYTSADSVLQIAAHEEHFGLERLYTLCELARTLVNPLHIGRVIARPFIGTPHTFKRTGNRQDYATPPPKPTLLDHLSQAGRDVIGIGKVSDIFAHQGITQSIKADGNTALFDATIAAMRTAAPGSLIFSNFVDFDSSYGHRRDTTGYAHALEVFDARMPELDAVLNKDDLVIIAADHGCDPTLPGSDHTREHIPVLAFGPNAPSRFIGRRDTFADIGQSIAQYLCIDPLDFGQSFIEN